MTRLFSLFVVLVFLLAFASQTTAQSTTGSISGFVTDQQQAVIPNASVTARNVETNFSRTTQTDNNGRYQFVNLPVGAYEIMVEATNFAKYKRSGVTLLLNQQAVVDVTMSPASLQAEVNVTENASVLNTTTSEVSTRFDERRLTELPIAPNRNVYNVVLSVPGVSQLGSGQQGFANGLSFSANGGRVRSNNFMIDGQDINDPSVSGGQQSINNPDIVQEFRIITNQFLAEYGRNSGSVLNIVTKGGTNDYHGTLFWFHNSNRLNSRNNLDKAVPGRTRAPFLIENQIGFTFGGPLHLPWFGEGGPTYINGRDRTFFFGSYQRWNVRQLGSGFTLNGAPTEAGRQILQTAVGNRPQVQALLRFLPAAQGPCALGCAPIPFTANSQNYSVPVGAITGSATGFFNDHQASLRIDHQFNSNNRLSGRYLYDDGDSGGNGQVTPPGLTTLNVFRSQAANVTLSSVLSPRFVNEFRVAYSRFATVTNAEDPSSEAIPSIEINQLGLVGFNAAANRTAIGLAVNLPQFRTNNTYQIQDSISFTSGNHSMKFGADIRKTDVKSFFVPTIRGLLRYGTLQQFVDDQATLGAQVNRPLPGGVRIQYYRYFDLYFFAQDEWKIRPNLTLTYGLRYEAPGNSFDELVATNNKIVAANNNDERLRYSPVPEPDRNNFQPRIGINWNPRTREDGIIGFITGGDKLVFRAGYARTYDANFINVNLNVATAAPFVAAINLPAVNSFASIPTATFSTATNPLRLARTIVAADFRAPAADQVTVELQRELSKNLVFRIGYVGTRGTGLFQTIDGNPRLPTTTAFSAAAAPGSAANPCRVTIVDPTDCTQGIRRLRANAASSTYHSLQVSLDKRLSKGFSAGVHFTYSSFIDTASEIFNPSTGEVAVSQNSFNRNADRARSSYDRPLRLTGNVVYELPFFRDQKGFAGHLLGGWQVNSFFTFQSGAPFTVLNGADPTGALNGIDGLVGNSIRANLNTSLNLSGMSVEQIINAGVSVGGARNFFRAVTVAERLGNIGRNTLRADGIGNVDFGIIKNTRIAENQRLQFRVDMFNATNTRNFGIPDGRINSGNFLNQWATNGGNRRIIVGLRYVF
jgi:hypothetical protein